ncbi:MAG: YgjV family protein [Clostridia bacterium]|nr:YgjV family protein [Clostridia bacterium]
MLDFYKTHVELIAQAMGFVAMALTILSFQFRRHGAIMAMMTASGVFWVLHYLMLGLYPAVAINAMNIVRNYIYGLREKKNVNSKLIPAVFVVIAAGSVIATWENAWSVLPLMASVTATVANWQVQTKKLKLLSYPRYGLWLIYDLVNGAWAGAANDLFCIGSISVALIREHKIAQNSRDDSV